MTHIHRGSQRVPMEDRFWPKVAPAGPDECWLWQAALDRHGYGRIGNGGAGNGYSGAHRIAYELLIGEVPAGLHLDHLCRTPRCVNPYHLDPVTARVNVLRGTGFAAKNALTTHCPHGHEYTPENTYLSKRNQRNCRACTRLFTNHTPRTTRLSAKQEARERRAQVRALQGDAR